MSVPQGVFSLPLLQRAAADLSCHADILSSPDAHVNLLMVIHPDGYMKGFETLFLVMACLSNTFSSSFYSESFTHLPKWFRFSLMTFLNLNVNLFACVYTNCMDMSTEITNCNGKWFAITLHMLHNTTKPHTHMH